MFWGQWPQSTLGDLVSHQGTQWVAGAAKPRATRELIDFLNQAQKITNAFFSNTNGTTEPKFRYNLRFVPGQPPIHMTIDGKELQPVFQTNFDWPAPSVAQQGVSAENLLNYEGRSINRPFGKQSGIWGVFKFFQNAEQRVVAENGSSEPIRVKWLYMKGEGASVRQLLDPPAILEIVRPLPAGTDILNPAFSKSVMCAGQAVIPE